MAIETHVETAPEKEKRLTQAGIGLVYSIIDAYSLHAQSIVEYPHELPEGLREYAKNQVTQLEQFFDRTAVSVEARPYMPFANSLRLDESWTTKVYGYEVVFSPAEKDTEPVSAGLYVDMEGVVHIGVGDGWSSKYGNDPKQPALANQAMQEFYVSHILRLVDAGVVLRGARFPYMVSV